MNTNNKTTLSTTTTKIGLLAGSLKGAGAEKTILTLAEFLAKENCSVDLYLLGEGADYSASDHINIIQLSGKHHKDRKQHLKNLTTATHYDLFVTSRADYYDAIQCSNKFASVHVTPFAWVNNENKSRLAKYFKLRRIRKKHQGKRLIALSQGIKEDLVNNLGCRPQDITVINNPFDVEAICQAAQESGLLPNNNYIIYVASFIPRKRHKDLLQAFNLLNNKDIDLVLVGKGPLEEELRSLAQELKITDRVIFWGWDPNPYRLIHNAKLSTLTSEAEGLPRVLVESLLLGVPMVSTDCPSGPNEVMTKPFDQYLVPVGDIHQLADAITQALNDYPAIEQLHMERFNGKHVAKQYLNLIQYKQQETA